MAAKKTGISPDLLIHPGETIADVLEDRGITQVELATRTGVSPAYISAIISGKKNISTNFARSLEYALGIPKSFWLNLQANYDAERLEVKMCIRDRRGPGGYGGDECDRPSPPLRRLWPRGTEMNESVYVEKLTAFSALLRQEGLAVGLQETADACQILQELDLQDRDMVRGALCAVYAKSRPEQEVFYRAFDGFFVSAEQRQANLARQAAEAEELSRRQAEAEQDLQVRGQPMDLRDDLREVYVRMPEEKREYLRQLMEKTKENMERSPQLYSNFIRSVFMRFLLEQQMMMEDAAVGCEETDPDLALLWRDISGFKESDIPRAAALIARITQQLSAELSRRRQRGGHSGGLDFKRTIRRGLETGGSFYRLSFRKPRRRRRTLVLLCDVSGSMLQFSEFALRFIKSMSEVSDASRIFLFSESLHEVDAFALQNMDAFRDYVRSSGLFGKGTDLGTALEQLCARRPPILGPSATLLILSDTKTIDLPRALAGLEEAKRQTGKVLWLNPIPERKWPYVRSIQTVSALCQMAPCSTLEELGRACGRLMRM